MKQYFHVVNRWAGSDIMPLSGLFCLLQEWYRKDLASGLQMSAVIEQLNTRLSKIDFMLFV